MNTNEVTRLEIIDHTLCFYCKGKGVVKKQECEHCNGLGCQGRRVVMWDEAKQIDLELQDDDRTLKIFIHERYSE